MATKTPKYQVLATFHDETDDQLGTTMKAVLAGVYINTDQFPNPVVDAATFKAQDVLYSAALVAAKDGGSNAVAEKNKQRKASTRMLSKVARHVDEIANNDVAILTLSGFQISGPATPQELARTGVAKLVQKVSRQIVLTP